MIIKCFKSAKGAVFRSIHGKVKCKFLKLIYLNPQIPFNFQKAGFQSDLTKLLHQPKYFVGSADVNMVDRLILVGQVNGKLSAVYHKNDNDITSVSCEEQDEDTIWIC